MNPSFYTTVDDLINEISQINREIFPTNLHITEFYKIKNGFNYKCGTICFDVVYSYKANQFRLNKRNPFKEKEYYITLNEAKDLRESLLAIVLNLIEQSAIKEAKRNLIYSKATETDFKLFFHLVDTFIEIQFKLFCRSTSDDITTFKISLSYINKFKNSKTSIPYYYFIKIL